MPTIINIAVEIINRFDVTAGSYPSFKDVNHSIFVSPGFECPGLARFRHATSFPARASVHIPASVDQNADSTGCGMAFISWFPSQGITLNQIAQGLVALTAKGTFAQLYANLTSQTAGNAWPAFQAAIQNLANGVSNDDPFGGAAQPAQLSHLAPGRSNWRERCSRQSSPMLQQENRHIR